MHLFKISNFSSLEIFRMDFQVSELLTLTGFFSKIQNNIPLKIFKSLRTIIFLQTSELTSFKVVTTDFLKKLKTLFLQNL